MIARRLTRLTASAFIGAASSLALAALVLLSPAPARAADDDAPLDTKILRGLLETLGLRKDGDAINYQERAPLVIPPGSALPPPEKSEAALANNPAWPKDPDVERKKQETAVARLKQFKSADEEFRDQQRVLSPSELTPGPKPRTASRTGKPNLSASDVPDSGAKLTPSQLGYKGGLFSNLFGRQDDDVAKFTGEPPRASLTEPPPGYQTPSPDQPYGLGQRTTAPKATDYYLDHVTPQSSK